MGADEPRRPTTADLLRWSEALAGIARTGLGFTDSLYERERFEEVLHVAADIRAAAGSPFDPGELVDEWMKGVGQGVAGYVTPKVAVGAVVGNEQDEILLVQRADSGVWLYPTGWADVGYSASEVAVKEVREETGIVCEPVRLIAVLDGLRLGFTRIPLYSLVFQCRALGGDLRPHPLETADVGWFAGVDQAVCSRWETNPAWNPRVDDVVAIDDALGQPRGTLLRAAGYLDDLTTTEHAVMADPALGPDGRDAILLLVRYYHHRTPPRPRRRTHNS